MAKKETNPSVRPLKVIAREIRENWKRPYFGARPYLDAMSSLEKITDMYGWDSAKRVVEYFLMNASTWKGDKAKSIKQELKELIGYDKIKYIISYEGDMNKSLFLTNKKDLTHGSDDYKDAVLFKRKEADTIREKVDEETYLFYPIDGADRKSIQSILTCITDNEDEDEDMVNSLLANQIEIIKSLIDGCNTTYGDLLKQISEHIDLSKYMQ